MFEISKPRLIIRIDWSSKVNEALKLYDCDFDSAMSGLDIYGILVTDKKKILNESDLLFWNSKNTNTLNQITSSDNSVTCKQGILESDEFANDFESNVDGVFEIDLDLVNNNIQEIMFFIGRPPARDNNNDWINESLLKKVKNEFVSVDVSIEGENIKYSINYYYNKNGAITILLLKRNKDKWYISDYKQNEEYKNGLSEILNKFYTYQ
jgi:stress response protein SCP2